MGKYYWPGNRDEQEISIGALYAFKKLEFQYPWDWDAVRTPILISYFARNHTPWPRDTGSLDAECLATFPDDLVRQAEYKCRCEDCDKLRARRLKRRAAWDKIANHKEQVPYTPCSCGIYSMKHHKGWAGTVLCVVQISGKIIEGTLGYRSEKATLKAFLHYDIRPYYKRHKYDADNIAELREERLRAVANAYNLPLLWEWPRDATAEHIINMIERTTERAS